MKKFFAGMVANVVAVRNVAVAIVNFPTTLEKLSRAEAEVASLAAEVMEMTSALQVNIEEVDGMRTELSNKAGALEIAQEINLKDLAKQISRSDIVEAMDITAAEVAEEIDITDNIDLDEVASKVAENIDLEDMASNVYDKLDMNDLADKVIELLITNYSESRR
jgi:hypothetical protein